MFKLHHLFQSRTFKTFISLTNNIRGSNNINNLQRAFCSSNHENNIDFHAITNGDPELEHKLKVIMLEAEVMRQEGKLCPPESQMNIDHWRDALNCKSRSARYKYFEFLFKKYKRKENAKEKKLQKQLNQEERLKPDPKTQNESIEEFAHKYDLLHNNILIRIQENTMNQFYNSRLIQAMMYGQKLVIDCGYDTNMTKRENVLCAKQLMLLFAENRHHIDPFDLYFCNMNREGNLFTSLNKVIPTINDPAFPLNIHECSYLDLFPKNQLVYLTPHCREEMLEFDHDKVYIIGGIVDKVNTEPLSLAKAKKEGLKMTKLPLDRYLQWGSGSGKSLTLNQITSILLDVKSASNWEHALRHVPRRKIVEADNEQSTDQPLNRFKNGSEDRYSYQAKPNKRAPKNKWAPASKINFNELRYNPAKIK